MQHELAFGAPTDFRVVHDGHPVALALYERHYSSRKLGKKRKQAVGPGYSIILLTNDNKVLFVWRDYIDDCIDERTGSKQEGINCAVFRNEGPRLSSDLLLEAEQIAWQRWPGRRLYTYVSAAAVQSQNPGYCFKKAGWRTCGVTKKRKLLILEKLP